jgi:hypothetical protein
VPPWTIDDGAASFVLTGFSPGASVSPARGRWLVVENSGAQTVTVGDVVHVYEGPRHVADFVITAIEPGRS